MSKPFPILFITAMDVAGAVASSGLIKRLADEIPNARFTIVAGPASAPLFAELPGLDEIIVARKNTGRLNKLGLWRKLRDKRWGLVVDTWDSGLSRFLRRKKRAVFKDTGEARHPVLQAADLLGLEDDPPAPFLFVGAETEAAALDYLGRDRPILAIAPGAEWVGRAWPAERYVQVASRLLGEGGPMEGGRLLVLGDAQDVDAAEMAKFQGARQYVLGKPGELDLLRAYAALKHARLFIGNDCSWMHVAAAAGAPTLGVFGPSDERIAAPWGKARVVRGHRPYEAFLVMDPTLSHAISHLVNLPVSTVLDAAMDLFHATQPQAATVDG